MPSHPVDESLSPRHDIPRGGRSGFVIVEERQVHYLEWGHRELPPVLCLHGGGQTAYMFEEVGAAASDRFHLLAPDLPNHGDSDPIDEGFGPWGIAKAMVPLMDAFGFDRFTLVGASLGGLTSIRMTELVADRILSIALIDVGHKLEPEGVRKIVDFMRAHESFASLDDAAQQISQYLPQRKAVRPESLSRNLRERADGRWVWKHGFGQRLRGGEEHTHPADNLEQFLDGIEDAARLITCPVLVLRGQKSDVLSEAGAEALTSVIPGARLVVVEKAGHLAAGDNPESTTALIVDFLVDTCTPPPTAR